MRGEDIEAACNALNILLDSRDEAVALLEIACRQGEAISVFRDQLDGAAACYRKGLKHILEECGNDKPRIEHIREAAEQAISSADSCLTPRNAR